MGRAITISSGKGGVGKTTTAINISAILNEIEKSAILIDANLTTPNVSIHLGAPHVPVCLHHVLKEKAKLQEAIYEHKSGMKVLSASIALSNIANINHEKLYNVIRDLRKRYSFVIIDSAPGFGKDLITAIHASDSVLVVTQAELPALTDALKTIKIVEKLDKRIEGIVLTRVRKDKHELSINEVEEILGYRVLAVIPEDKAVRESIRLKNAVVLTRPKSKSAIAYKKLAYEIAGKRYKEQKWWKFF